MSTNNSVLFVVYLLSWFSMVQPNHETECTTK